MSQCLAIGPLPAAACLLASLRMLALLRLLLCLRLLLAPPRALGAGLRGFHSAFVPSGEVL